MKRLVLLISIFYLLTCDLKAATISGTVTNASTGLPVSGQLIYIADTLGFFADSVFTNSSGFYLDSLPVMSARPIRISTSACGVVHMASRFFNGSSNISYSFSVCFPPSNILHGNVLLDSLPNTGIATVYLLRKQYDSVLADSTIIAIDSFNTAASGGAFARSYSSIPTGSLLLKAALKTSHPYYAISPPTYYGNAIAWSNASPLTSNNFDSTTATNITMVKAIKPPGPGFIGGSVLVGANKSTAVGDPLNNRIVLLTNSAGKAVAYTYTNASGQFQFSNLAYGTYKLFGDAWGKSNPTLTVTITSFRPSISNILFEENNKTFRGTVFLGIGSTALAELRVYPNPASDFIHIDGLSKIRGEKSYVLSSITGVVIARETISQTSSPVISTSALAPGMYLLTLHTSEGSASFKVIK